MPFYRCFAQDSLYEIDLARQVPQKTAQLDFSCTDPEGATLSVNNRYFERDGKPWFPLMGEFHYSRYPQQYWEEEIVKMKSAGLSIISTYIFWDVHENPRNQWNWQGTFDLRHFIELCEKHEMYVWIRIGPYDNAELLYGGLPKWIAGLKGKRSNDSTYLEESLKLYRQIGKQTKGLYFKDGGPIIGAQLENEYDINNRDHIGTLKQMALKSGITPVFFSVTANTVFRDDKFKAIPLQGAYPYRGWEKAGGSASKDFLYGNDQWILTDANGKVYYDVNKYPKGLCEQGCGGQITYANRFVVDPGIVEAHLQNQIGRGMNMVGYYMFQGGTQLPEFKSPDCPVSYDFQAPINEFGFVQPSYRYLKILHNFLRDFGSDLAAMNVVEPLNPVRDEYDTTNLRYVVRTSGNSGFVFLCNTQIRVHMQDKVFRMRLKLANETIEFPRAPLHFTGGTTAILPFNLLLNGALLKYATVQPVSRFSWNNKQILFLMEVKGMNMELAFDEKTITSIKAEGWEMEKSDGKIYLTPRGGREILITSSTGQSSVIILLSREQAENSWRTTINKQEVMVISKADLMFEKNAIECRQFGSPFFSLDMYPSITAVSENKFTKAVPASIFKRYEFRVPAVSLNLDSERIAPDSLSIVKPARLPASLSDIRLQIDYLGGSAEILANNQILTDNLFNGSTWSVGLNRYISDDTIKKIECRVLPWQNYITGVPDILVKKIKESPPQIINIKVVPQYRICVGLGALLRASI